MKVMTVENWNKQVTGNARSFKLIASGSLEEVANLVVGISPLSESGTEQLLKLKFLEIAPLKNGEVLVWGREDSLSGSRTISRLHLGIMKQGDTYLLFDTSLCGTVVLS